MKKMIDDKNETEPIPANKNNEASITNKKKKRPYCEILINAYSSVSFSPIQSAVERPDSPSYFFSSSHAVTLSSVSCGRKDRIEIQQIVHQHINGLCIVTVGQLSLPSSTTVKSIRFVAKEAPPCSAAMKRKRQAKMLKGGKLNDVVYPSTVLAELILEDKHFDKDNNREIEKRITTIPLHACVWGTIIELNRDTLTPKLLLDDPLLDGYIAIILPSGKFPPEI